MSNGVRYIIYARKSSESEDRQVQSIGDQLDALRDCAKRLKLNVIYELTEAKSAKDPGVRQVFLDLLKKIERNEADGILCWNINRLSRNPVDSGQISWLLQRGVLKSIRTMDREYLPEDNVLLMAVESGVANQYVIDLRKAVVRGLESKANKGWFPGKAPPGYVNNPLTREIDIDETHFQTVRHGWDMLLSGTHAVTRVGQQLSAKGLPLLSRSNAYKLFSNPFYYGWFKYSGSLYRGNHTAMISKDEFDRVQELVHGTHNIRPQRHEIAFTGLIFCGHCGCLVTAEKQVKHYKTTRNTCIYVYYRCTGSKGCTKTAVREEYIQETIASEIRRCSINPKFATILEKMVKRFELSRSVDSSSSREILTKKLDDLLKRKDKLLDLRMSGEIDAGEYSEYKSRNQTEMVSCELSLSNLETKHHRDVESLASFVRFTTKAHNMFISDDLRSKRAAAVALSEEYVLTDRKLKIRSHSLLARVRIFEPLQENSDMVASKKSASMSPLLYGWLDDIRTFIANNDVPFYYNPRKSDDVNAA